MGRSPCCDKLGLKKGPWTPEEDQKLLAFIEEHGHGNWRALPSKAGLQRCGKSCRLRWTNYLRADIKRGKFSLQEQQTIIQLHALLGNRWSAIATHLPKRTDNEIKNYWNTHLKKRLAKMGIDPVTHKPKNDTDGGQQLKNAANLSHMAQWESARLEAEARLVHQSKLRPSFTAPSPDLLITDDHQIMPTNHYLSISSAGAGVGDGCDTNNTLRCLDVLKAWQGIESPTAVIEFMGHYHYGHHNHSQHELSSLSYIPSSSSGFQDINALSIHQTISTEESGEDDDDDDDDGQTVMEGFTELLLGNNNTNMGTKSEEKEEDEEEEEDSPGTDNSSSRGSGNYEENKNYWNSILNLVNISPHSPMF